MTAGGVFGTLDAADTAIGGEERFFLLWPIRELAAASG